MPTYDHLFYEEIKESSRHSARTILPILMELTGPLSSVVDVGCGNGVWLSVFRELGSTRTIGLDGDHIDRSHLEIEELDFITADLNEPLPIEGPFDLALTLEVVEHLPKKRAELIVEELCNLAPIALFSAAVPLQTGEGHINEEWQQVWAARFEKRGYRTLDPIRSHIWQNPSVSWWYQQNLLVFASDATIEDNPRFKAEADKTDRQRLSVIHPRMFRDRHSLLVKLERERSRLEADVRRLSKELAAARQEPEISSNG